MKIRQPLVTLWVFAVFAFGQTPKPFIQTTIAHGTKQLTGNYNPLPAGIAPTFELQVKRGDGQFGNRTADFNVNVVRGLYTVMLAEELEANDQVKVILSTGGNRAESDTVTVAAAPKPSVIEVRSVEAVYGTKKVTINFAPVPSPIGRPTIKIEAQDLFQMNAPITEEQMKAGKAEVTLPGTLLPKGSFKIKVGDKEYSVEAPAIRVLPAPLREGATEITGSASGVDRVCVAVLAAASSSTELERRMGRPAGAPRSCDEARWVNAVLEASLLQSAVRSEGPQLSTIVFDASSQAQKLSALKNKLGSQAQAELLLEQVTERDITKAQLDQILTDPEASLVAADTYLGELMEEAEVAVDKGTFKFSLSRPLEGGSKVFIRPVITEAVGGSQVLVSGPDPLLVQPGGVEFGRARFFLTVGATLSQSNNSFGQADPYVSFAADGTIVNGLVSKKKPQVNSTRGSRADVGDLLGSTKFGFSLHWTAAVRLTQTGTVAPLNALSPALQSAQSAVFFGGVYLPMRMNGMDWVYRGTQYSAFLGPSVRAGVTTVKDGVILAKDTSSTTTMVSPCVPLLTCNDTKAGTPVPKIVKGPAPFYGIGFRFGIMRYDLMGSARRNRQISPDPVAYIDVTWGQNQAYVTPGVATTTTTTTTQDHLLGTQRVTSTAVAKSTHQGFTFDPRIAVEARVKIPYIPAEIGADVNMKRKAPLASYVGGDGFSGTDYRFLFGFRVDVAKSLSTVFGKK